MNEARLHEIYSGIKARRDRAMEILRSKAKADPQIAEAVELLEPASEREKSVTVEAQIDKTGTGS